MLNKHNLLTKVTHLYTSKAESQEMGKETVNTCRRNHVCLGFALKYPPPKK